LKLDKVYIWCDYFSIAQESKLIQKYAIMSLPAVASTLHAFVVIAPEEAHHDNDVTCDLSTYKKRGWCRAEVMSHVSRRGTKNMFIGTGEQQRSVEDEDLNT